MCGDAAVRHVKQYRNIVKNTGGMTLVELLVAMALTIIVLGGVILAFVTGNNVVKSTNSSYDEHVLAMTLEEKIENTVRNATSLTIYDSTASLASATDGYLYFGTDPNNTAATGLVIKKNAASAASAFNSGGYSGYAVTVKFSKASAKVLTVSITIAKVTGITGSYTLTSNFTLNNINSATGSDAAINDNTTVATGNKGILIGYKVYQT